MWFCAIMSGGRRAVLVELKRQLDTLVQYASYGTFYLLRDEIPSGFVAVFDSKSVILLAADALVP